MCCKNYSKLVLNICEFISYSEYFIVFARTILFHNQNICYLYFRLLGLCRVPLSIGRVVNLKTEILPVATESLSKTFFTKGMFF